MRPFLSSTFLDLIEERNAVLESLRKMRLVPHAMEDFLATPNPSLVTALEHLRDSDLMLLVIGFKAGTLLPDGSGSTYTSAEYDELLRLGKEPLVCETVDDLIRDVPRKQVDLVSAQFHNGNHHLAYRNDCT